MKTFLFKLFLFLLLLQTPMLIEAILPFNYLPYDVSNKVKKKNFGFPYGSYFPNIDYTGYQTGALAKGTEHSIARKNRYITDKLGFRNDTFIYNPDIVLLGDSQTEGSLLTQDEIFSNVLSKKINAKIYNIAYGTPQRLEQMVYDSVIQRPKIVIFERVEREVFLYKYDAENLRTGKQAEFAKFIGTNNNVQSITNFLSKYFRQYFVFDLDRRIKGRYKFPKSIKYDSVYFYQGKDAEVKISDERFQELINDFVKLNEYYKKHNTIFIFFPYPVMETIYFEEVPFENQPKFMPDLIKALEEKNVPVINTVDILMQNKDKTLYFTDDSHWTPETVEILSQHIVEYLQENHPKLIDDIEQ